MKMKKLMAALLSFVLLLSVFPVALADTVPNPSFLDSLDDFKVIRTYHDGQFSDVAATEWYAQDIRAVYECGLMVGTSGSQFLPLDNLSVAQALTIACRIHNIYNGGDGTFQQGTPWYQVYVDYALKTGIIYEGEFRNYNAIASRGEIAAIFVNSVPAEALRAINSFDVAQSDVLDSLDALSDEEMIDAIDVLYCAGVMVGVQGEASRPTLQPNEPVTRSQIAAVATRMIDPERRITVQPMQPQPQPSQSLYAFLVSLAKEKGTLSEDGAEYNYFFSSSDSSVSRAQSLYWLSYDPSFSNVYFFFRWGMEDGAYYTILEFPESREEPLVFIFSYSLNNTSDLSADTMDAHNTGIISADYAGAFSDSDVQGLQVIAREGPDELIKSSLWQGIWMLPNLLNTANRLLFAPKGYSVKDLGLTQFVTTDVSQSAYDYLVSLASSRGRYSNGNYNFVLDTQTEDRGDHYNLKSYVLSYFSDTDMLALSTLLGSSEDGENFSTPWVTIMLIPKDLTTPYEAVLFDDNVQAAAAYIPADFTGTNAKKISAESDMMFTVLTASVQEAVGNLFMKYLMPCGYSPADIGLVNYLGIRS